MRKQRLPSTFFLLVFVLSVPLWVLGSATGLPLFAGLPASSLMVVCPALAAVILVYRESKTDDVRELLKRSFDFGRIKAKIWYVPILVLMPAVMVASYGYARWTGSPLPDLPFSVLYVVALFVVFFVAGLGEELGWMGYAVDPMQARGRALQAGLLLGVVWAAWHIIPLIQMQRSPAWIAWWCLFIVALRVLFVWLYNNTGKSVFAVTLFHAIGNVSMMLYPELFDPRVAGIIVASVAVVVTLAWGPRTLVRHSGT
jgi:membrane protease YdiL (CAAX protease family)